MSSNEHLHVESTCFESGSGNVFADLGLPDPQEALAKAGLAQEIAATIDHRGLTEEEATRIMGLDQPKASDLLRGRLARFSSDQLRRALLALRAPLSGSG